MFVYQPLRKRRFPTLTDTLRTIEIADNPDDRTRDVRPLMANLSRISMASPRLRGHRLVRRAGLTSFGWEIVPYDAADNDRAKRAAVRVRSTMNTLLKRYCDIPFFGGVALQLVWQPLQPAGTVPRVLRNYRPVEIERVGDDLSSLAIVSDQTPLTRTYIAQENPQIWLTGVDDELSEQGGILRTIAFHEILQNESYIEWANLIRKLKGMIVAVEKDGAVEEDKRTAAEALRMLVSNNFVEIGEGIDFQFKEFTSPQAGESFKSFKEALVADAAIACLGQANMSELPAGGGSRAALQVLAMIRADIRQSDVEGSQAIANEQLLLHDFQINDSPGATEAPWYMRIKTLEEEDQEANARIITEALGAGIPLIEEEVYARLGFTRPQEGDKVFTAQPKISIGVPTPVPPVPTPPVA